jgi:hypothetical protein
MVDDKTKRAADRRRINAHEAYELAYWSRKFGVSRERVVEAVQKVGSVADDVACEIQK